MSFVDSSSRERDFVAGIENRAIDVDDIDLDSVDSFAAERLSRAPVADDVEISCSKFHSFLFFYIYCFSMLCLFFIEFFFLCVFSPFFFEYNFRAALLLNHSSPKAAYDTKKRTYI